MNDDETKWYKEPVLYIFVAALLFFIGEMVYISQVEHVSFQQVMTLINAKQKSGTGKVKIYDAEKVEVIKAQTVKSVEIEKESGK